MRFPTRRVVVLAVVLAVAALVMPPATERHSDTSLVKVQTARAVDHPRSGSRAPAPTRSSSSG